MVLEAKSVALKMIRTEKKVTGYTFMYWYLFIISTIIHYFILNQRRIFYNINICSLIIILLKYLH